MEHLLFGIIGSVLGVIFQIFWVARRNRKKAKKHQDVASLPRFYR